MLPMIEEGSTTKPWPAPVENPPRTHTSLANLCTLHTKSPDLRIPNLLAWRTTEVLKAQMLLWLQQWLLKPECSRVQ